MLAATSIKNVMPKSFATFVDHDADVGSRRKAFRQLVDALDEKHVVPPSIDKMNPIERDRQIFGFFYLLKEPLGELDLRALAEQLEAIAPRPANLEGKPSVSLADTLALADVCALAHDKFTNAWDTFFDSSRPFEERSEAFSLIFGFVDQQMGRNPDWFASKDAKGRKGLTFISMISFPQVPKWPADEQARFLKQLISLPDEDSPSSC